jgi:recombinational DNA repair protein (RecF pathway)
VPARDIGSEISRLPQISGACLLALADEDYASIAENSVYLAELKRLMRYAVNHYLGNKKLKSRELFKPAVRS